MTDHEPPYLQVGTEVSAKYRGAFCEAKVKKVVRSVKCRITFKETGNSAVVNDDIVKGMVRTGSLVEVRHPESGQYVEATITKTTDSSMYTVVFDDGDERTLRRTMLCLKGNKHFIESETLDQLPLTHPEHFGTPVMRKKDKSRMNDSSESEESESEDDTPSKRRTYCGKLADCIGKVICVGALDKRKSAWYPALVVLPSAADVALKTKGHLLVRSFKDNKFYATLKKETQDFTREVALRKSDDKTLKVAIEKALLYLDNHELPSSWDLTALLGSDTEDVSEEDTSDEEPSEEKDRFVAQLFKFMDDRGTPINKAPTIGMKDLNLYRLYKLVKRYGGFNKVTSQMRWRLIYSKMNLPATNAASTSIMAAYKKYLHAFENFDRRLGSNMTSSSRPHRSRNMRLFRQSDRQVAKSPKKKSEGTPTKEAKSEPSPCKTESPVTPPNEEKGEKSTDDGTPKRPVKLPPMVKATTRSDHKKLKSSPGKKEEKEKEPEKEKKSEPKKKEQEPKEKEKSSKKKEEKKAFVKIEVKKEVEEKLQSQKKEEEEGSSLKTPAAKKEKKETTKEESTPAFKGRRGSLKNMAKKTPKETKDEESDQDIVVDDDDTSDNSSMASSGTGKGKRQSEKENYPIGTKLGVRYGRGRNLKIYEAKIVDMTEEGGSNTYRVHYNGWNIRYDEWIKKDRIVYKIPDDKQPAPKTPPTSSPKKTPVASSSKPPATPKHTHPLLSSAEKQISLGSLKATPGSAKTPPHESTKKNEKSAEKEKVVEKEKPAKTEGKEEKKKTHKEEEKKEEKKKQEEPELKKEEEEEQDEEEEEEIVVESPTEPPRPTRSNSIEMKTPAIIQQQQAASSSKPGTRRSRRLSGHMDENEEELELKLSDNEEEEDVVAKAEEAEKEDREETKVEEKEEKEDSESQDEINLQCTEEFEPMIMLESEVAVKVAVAMETAASEEPVAMVTEEVVVDETTKPDEQIAKTEVEVEEAKETHEAKEHEEKSKSVMANLDAILEAAGQYNDADDEEFFSMYGPTSTEERKRKRKKKDDSAKKRAKKKKKEDILVETPPTSPEGSSPGRGNPIPEEEQSTKSEHEANVEVAHYMTTSGQSDSPLRDSPKEEGGSSSLKRKADDKHTTPRKIKRPYKRKHQTHASDSDSEEARSGAHASSSHSSTAVSSPYKKQHHHHHHHHNQPTGKRSPRVSKYNFYLDAEAEELAREERIAILQSRINEIRKIYMDLKTEVAMIDRRRKRARRKEREAEREAAAALLQQSNQTLPAPPTQPAPQQCQSQTSVAMAS